MDSTELLKRLYKNADMGIEATSTIIGKTNNQDMRNVLADQLSEYQSYARSAKNALSDRKIKAEPEKAYKRIAAKAGIVINTAIDSSVSHIAEMMINGSGMSIIDLSRNKNRYSDDSDSYAISLCEKMLENEKNNIQSMQSFL